jgi:formate dehydrogenase accessory protein FdhE
MRRGPRGGPAQLQIRLSRADHLLADAAPSVAGPFSVLAAVLRHQLGRLDLVAPAPIHPGAPLLDLAGAAPAIVAELPLTVAALADLVPAPLAEAGTQLSAAVVETWLDDPALVDPRLAFWVLAAAGPVLERGAASVSPPGDWQGAACPACGASPQASVIAEESGEFMAGSPRSLVCGRCATWWPYRRATCAGCGEEDPRLIEAFLDDGHRWVRVDTCATCRSYVKTFDLREPGAVDVVPLVDDVASLTLDVWAQQRGFTRSSTSLAGV